MRETVHVLVKKLKHAEDLPLPRFMSEEAAGMDIFAAVEKEVVIEPGKFVLVPTGIMMAIPPGFEAQVRPRSGLAFKHGITILNSPGTIDADYRGEIKVLLINLGYQDYTIVRGERIAQLVIHALPAVKLIQAEELPPSSRGGGGFGHTGSF
ncbi:MAG: dUTP diphosphatase [Firmicutes bacterium]|nr:dUTP diphosphatase [Bacillota bacterium]